MQYTVDAYRIIIDETNNPVEIQRQNKMVVNILVRYLIISGLEIFLRKLKELLENKIISKEDKIIYLLSTTMYINHDIVYLKINLFKN